MGVYPLLDAPPTNAEQMRCRFFSPAHTSCAMMLVISETVSRIQGRLRRVPTRKDRSMCRPVSCWLSAIGSMRNRPTSGPRVLFAARIYFSMNTCNRRSPPSGLAIFKVRSKKPEQLQGTQHHYQVMVASQTAASTQLRRRHAIGDLRTSWRCSHLFGNLRASSPSCCSPGQKSGKLRVFPLPQICGNGKLLRAGEAPAANRGPATPAWRRHVFTERRNEDGAQERHLA